MKNYLAIAILILIPTVCWAEDNITENTQPFSKRSILIDKEGKFITVAPILIFENEKIVGIRGYEVRSSQGELIQIVKHDFLNVSSDPLSLVDYNFDDSLDLMLEVEGGSAPNIYYTFWRFDSKKGEFVDETEYMEDFAISGVNEDLEILYSYWRSGSSKGSTHYVWFESKLVVAESYSTIAWPPIPDPLLEEGYFTTKSYFSNGVIRKRVLDSSSPEKTEYPMLAVIERYDNKGKLISRKKIVREKD